MDLWFGDSWVVGSELAKLHGKYEGDQRTYNNSTYGDTNAVDFTKCRPDLAFPNLVSKSHINLGANGTGIEYCLWRLHNYLLRGGKADRAFFGLSHIGRKTSVRNDGKIVKSEARRWWSDNDDLENTHYHTANLTNTLHLMCEAYNIKAYFFPLWCPAKMGRWSMFSKIPSDRWLVDPNSTLAEQAFDFNVPVRDWKKNKNAEPYQLYIAPCRNHPNKQGHEKIAEYIKSVL
jgi:hypothetical protein